MSIETPQGVGQNPEVNEQNAVAVRSLALLGVDLCNRLSSLIVRGAEADFPSDWVANARRQFERLTHEALRHEKS